MNATRKVKLKDISSNLSCNLCRGYMIDATTTIECLHSFCKSCIVKHLENSEYCPVCDVQLHSTKPLSGIRSDQMLQEIIYKLVPGIFTREMERRRQFYSAHPASIPTSQLDSGQIFKQPYITSGDKINISMECSSTDKNVQENSRRYLQTPAGVSVNVLRQWVQGKYELPKDADIEVMYGGRVLPHEFLLMDIAYKYSWTESMTKPLQLTYRVRGTPKLASYAHPYQATSPTKRKARSLTDSEVLKSSNVANSLASTISHMPQLKQLVSNGKVNGKKKLSSTFIPNEINAMEKVDVKRKKMSNNAVKIDFKDMESQCTEGTELNGHKEVQLQISESGVISAKSIISGIEKIIARTDPSVDHNNEHLHEKSKIAVLPPVQPGSEPESQIKPQINGVNSNSKINFNYVKLNIPAVNGHLLNSIPPPVKIGKLASSKKSIKSSPLQKSLLITPSDKKQAGRKVSSNLDTTFESKKANMQKAIQDLHRQHLNASSTDNVVKNPQLPMEQNNVKQSINKISANSNGTKTSMNSQSVLGNNSHHNPLPFPLSALASSGMTVNLIPSIEVKQPSNGFKGREILHDSPPPSLTKKLKHQTTISNGEIRFTSPRHILPTTSKTISTCTPSPSVEASPTKPRKFFKSKQSADTESPRKPVDNNNHNNNPKSPVSNNSTISTSKQNGSFSSNGFHGPTVGDLKLINSTSSNTKLNQTMTTPSRMATPTTTAVHSASMYSPPNSINQLFQYWNALQFSSPLGGLPQPNFFPLVTNNFASMPYFNSRPFNDSVASLSTASTYPMVCSTNFLTNQSELSSSSLSGFKNGVLNNNVAVPKTQATEVTLPIKTKQKTSKDNNTSLDLSLKKIRAAISKENLSKGGQHSSSSSLKDHTSPKNNSANISQSSSTQQNLNTKSHQVSENVENSQPELSDINSDSNEISEILEKQSSPLAAGSSPPPASNSDSGVDSGLSTTSENCDKEVELNCLTNNEIVDTIADGNSREEPESSNVVATDIENCTFSSNKEESINEETICRPSSPSNSNDSTDLVINEDCVVESSDANSIDPIEGSEIPKCSTEETIQSDSNVKKEVVHLECSNHPLNEKGNCTDDDTTLSSPCNNNNDPPPSADSCLSIPANKLANNSESSTTGA